MRLLSVLLHSKSQQECPLIKSLLYLSGENINQSTQPFSQSASQSALIAVSNMVGGVLKKIFGWHFLK